MIYKSVRFAICPSSNWLTLAVKRQTADLWNVSSTENSRLSFTPKKRLLLEKSFSIPIKETSNKNLKWICHHPSNSLKKHLTFVCQMVVLPMFLSLCSSISTGLIYLSKSKISENVSNSSIVAMVFSFILSKTSMIIWLLSCRKYVL